MVHAKPADNAPWTAEGQEKRDAVQSMFAEIAPTYDLCNSLMSMNLHRRWRTIAASKLKLVSGNTALDVCCGTGDFIAPLRRGVGAEGRVYASDFCLPMLERAKNKSSDGLALADACRLPYTNAIMDAVSVGWGIRNVPDIDGAHREIARVLKPGGRFVSLDMARPRNGFIRTTSEWIFNAMIPFLGTLFRKRKAYTYLPKSTAKFMTREELKQSMEKAGFTDVGYRDLFFGNICVHWGQKA
ncbi:MAG TPA: bifunctional demethylmenaquinone methyltransferase/2-methoxy-6-polyprenyl-1,4-benzoquinol methylase UbiE [Fimbriimonadaceae bacterium]|jgi:demethylmenaquinone methyltransferase/2-methoxy-6-polyprenyl-1,4-benzoquinol methylase